MCCEMIFFFNRPAEILDGLRDFLSDNILATLSYILSFMQTIVRMLHHAAIIHEDVQYRIYDISINHKDTVQKLLTNVDPNFYRKLVKSFSRLDFVEVGKRFNYFCITFHACRTHETILAYVAEIRGCS